MKKFLIAVAIAATVGIQSVSADVVWLRTGYHTVYRPVVVPHYQKYWRSWRPVYTPIRQHPRYIGVGVSGGCCSHCC